MASQRNKRQRVDDDPIVVDTDVEEDPPEQIGRASSKVDFSKVSIGEWQSRVTYVKVIDKDEHGQTVENERGFSYRQTSQIPEAESYSASQYSNEETVTRTQIVDILENARDTIFTVGFFKQPDAKLVAQKIKELDLDSDEFNTKNGKFSDAKLKKYVRDHILRGDYRVLVGYLVQTEPKMGRTQVVDVNIPTDQYRQRQVDHRTITSLIIRGTKYNVKI